MKRQLTLREYRWIDLGLFALMFAVFEFVIVWAANSTVFWDQSFTVSLAAAITAIVYMRWGLWGGIHAGLTGLLFCFYSGLYLGSDARQYAIYIIGNLFSLAAVPLLKKLGPERVRTSPGLALLFPLLVILLMQGGRAAVALVLGMAPGGAVGFFTTDALSDLFTVVIVWIVRRLDGVYEEQRHYLLRVQEEMEKERKRRMDR